MLHLYADVGMPMWAISLRPNIAVPILTCNINNKTTSKFYSMQYTFFLRQA
jgi:hypothetical protein